MHNKEWYAKKAKEHFRAYLMALDSLDFMPGSTHDEYKKLMKFHEKEYLTYKKASDSQ